MTTRRIERSLLCLLVALLWNSSVCLHLQMSQQEAPPRRASRRRSILIGGATWAASSLAIDPVKAAMAPPTYDGIVMPGGAARFAPEADGQWNDLAQQVTTKLGQSRILANELSPLQQPAFGDQELYYAPFLFGAWNATATLKRKVYPYGIGFLPSKSLIEGSPRNREEKTGFTCSYEVHYFSTLANTLGNNLRVNLGTGVPQTKIIQDRAFNAISISSAYQQLTPVQEVEWDYRDNPTKVKLDFGAGPLTSDMRPLGQRRTEIFLNARTYEDSGDVYCTAERSRSVTLGVGTAVVSDIETITEFRKVTDDRVSAISRIAVYLTPNPNSREGVLWQQVGGKAVAFFDYDIEMNRLKETFTMDDGTKQERACVTTPKDIVQCY